MQKYIKPSIAGIINSVMPEQKQKFKIKLSQKEFEAIENVSLTILAIIACAGVVALAAVAPNIFLVFKKLTSFKRLFNNEPKVQKRKIEKSFYYLKQKGYIKLIPYKNNFKVVITEKGKNRITLLNFENLKIPKTKEWDKKWWFVLADIPSSQLRSRADLFRKKIKELGLYAMQRTVWVYPFDPRNEIAFISAHYGIEKYVTVLEASSVDEQDEKLFKSFFKI